MQYPFNSDTISKENAVQFIASVVYPTEKPITANKRVRSRIQYALTQKAISEINRGEFAAAPFFSWAVEQKGWSALGNIVGLPHAPRHSEAVPYSTGHATDELSDVFIPADYGQLKQAHEKLAERCHQLEKENAALRTRNAELERECAEWRRKDAARRAKNSDSGKRNKGVPRPRQ